MGGFRSGGINVGNIRQNDPGANLTAANKLFSNISERVRGRAISKVLGETQLDSNDILGSQDTLRSNLVRAGATPMEALGLVNKAITPYTDQRAYDRGVLTSDRSHGLAGAGLSERIRHNTAMEKKPSAGSRDRLEVGEDDFGNPYIINKDNNTINYDLTPANSIKPNTSTVPKKEKLNFNGYAEQPIDTVAMNDVVDTNAQPAVALTDTEQRGAYEQNFIELAESRPSIAGTPNTPVAGVGAGMPQADAQNLTGKNVMRGYDANDISAITYDQGASGRRYYQYGQVATPPKYQKLQMVKQQDGSSRNVVIDERTGKAINPAEQPFIDNQYKDPTVKVGNDEFKTKDIKWKYQTHQLPNGQSEKIQIGTLPTGQEVKYKDGKVVSYKAGLGIKEPTLLQDDKKFISNLGTVGPAMGRVGTSIIENKDIFGPIAAWFDRKTPDKDFVNVSGVGQLFGTDDSKKAAQFDGDTARMMAKVIKSLGANPSDRDLKLLEAQVPLRSDEPETARVKLDNFKEQYYDTITNTFTRLLESNPSTMLGKLVVPEVADRLTGRLPADMMIWDENGTLSIRRRK